MTPEVPQFPHDDCGWINVDQWQRIEESHLIVVRRTMQSVPEVSEWIVSIHSLGEKGAYREELRARVGFGDICADDAKERAEDIWRVWWECWK